MTLTKNKGLMKKIVVLLAFFTFALTATAQEEPLRFGFQLSPTFSWMTANTNRINSSGTNLGIKVGMIGEFYFADNYAFTSGIGFAFNHGGTLQHERAGCYWDRSDLGLSQSFYDSTAMCYKLPEGVKLQYKIQYLEIPFGLKMSTRDFGYISYFLEPMLTLGIKTQANGSVEGRGIGNDAEKVNIKKEVNSINLSYGLNVGAEYSISENTSLVGGLGIQVGFTDVTQDGDPVESPDTGQLDRQDNSTGQNTNLIIRLGIMF